MPFGSIGKERLPDTGKEKSRRECEKGRKGPNNGRLLALQASGGMAAFPTAWVYSLQWKSSAWLVYKRGKARGIGTTESVSMHAEIKDDRQRPVHMWIPLQNDGMQHRLFDRVNECGTGR